MRRTVRALPVLATLAALCSCSRPAPRVAQAATAGTLPTSSAPVHREIRITGTVQAVHYSKVLVPAIYGQGGSVTLTRLIPNGSHVKEGDLIAEFDSQQQ